MKKLIISSLDENVLKISINCYISKIQDMLADIKESCPERISSNYIDLYSQLVSGLVDLKSRIEDAEPFNN